MASDPLVTLDVSALEAPEPLLRALEALQGLPRGQALRLVHRMRPRLLYDHLPALGFEADTRAGPDGRCEVYLWRRDDPAAQAAVRARADELPPWRE